ALVTREPHPPNAKLTPSFYDRQHADIHYRQNNWLLDQLHIRQSVNSHTVVEIGCGNGRFLRAIAPRAAKVFGVDWAQSPELSNLPDNVELRRLDVITDTLPAGDLI